MGASRQNTWAASIANPAPLGLFSFGLTTFVVCCYDAGVLGVGASDPTNVAVAMAVFYGGAAEMLAGMWAFACGNTFAATAFTSYGAFWLSYAALFIPWFGIADGYNRNVLGNDIHAASVLSHAKGTYLLGWTIFTYMMLVASIRTSKALCLLFCVASLTLTLLTGVQYGNSVGVHRIGGFMGILTALVAWYTALAALLDSQPKPLFSLPVGDNAQADVDNDDEKGLEH